MNFHKTIGYLAALLLMVGFGVPDSFAQDVDVSSVTLSLSSRTLRDSTTAAVTVTATVNVTLADVADADGQDVTINIAGTADESYTLSNNTNLTVNIPTGQSSGSDRFPIEFTFTTTGPPKGDTDPDDEKITVTATATGAGASNADVISDGIEVTITDHAASMAANAQSIRGMRVVIAAPAANAWAPTGNSKITGSGASQRSTRFRIWCILFH